jgi:hypothetical protein
MSRPSSHEPPEPMTSGPSSSKCTKSTSLNRQRLLEKENSSNAQKRRKADTQLAANTTCELCRNIDFGRALLVQNKILQNHARGIYIADLGTFSSDNGCASCALFSGLRIPSSALGDSQGYQLRAYSYLKYNISISFRDIPSKLRGYDLPYIAVISEGLDSRYLAKEAAKIGQLYLQESTIRPCLLSPQIVPQHVDFSGIAILLDYCIRNHKKLCSTSNQVLVAMQVIDCQSMAIISAPTNCSYAALSYVWGGGRNQDSAPALKARSSRSTLKLLPRVISDAIVVAKKLNIRYLWVDKYCETLAHKCEEVC